MPEKYKYLLNLDETAERALLELSKTFGGNRSLTLKEALKLCTVTKMAVEQGGRVYINLPNGEVKELIIRFANDTVPVSNHISFNGGKIENS